jgi:hypothetical protein
MAGHLKASLMKLVFKLWSPLQRVNTHPFLGRYLHEFWSVFCHPLLFKVFPLLFKSPHMGLFVIISESTDKEVQHYNISFNLKSNINSGGTIQMLHFFMVRWFNPNGKSNSEIWFVVCFLV